MKKRIMYIIIMFSLLFVTNASAEQYDIKLYNNDTIEAFVVGSSTPISDYSSILSYSNDTLTIKEGAEIRYLYLDKSTTITSDDKGVSVNYMYKLNSTSIVEVIIKNLHALSIIDGSNSSNLNVFGFNKITVLDSIFDNFYELETCYKSNDNRGIVIKNSTLNGARMEVYGDLLIEDSTVNTYDLIKQQTVGEIRIVNSNIKYNKIYANGGGTSLYADNSTFILYEDAPNFYGSLSFYTSENKDAMVLNNTTIESKDIYTSGQCYNGDYGKLIMNESTINTAKLNTNCGIEATKSTIKAGVHESSGSIFKLTDSFFYHNNGSTSKYAKKIIIDNSYYEGTGAWYQTSDEDGIIINNSYFRLNDSCYIQGAGTLKIANSNFYINQTARINGNIEFDDDVIPVDENGNVKIIGDIDGYHGFTYENGEYSNSTSLISKVKVIFKVENGTWADGTTDDIVISKDIWEKLSLDEIPVELVNNLNGAWDKAPNIDDYITSDTVFTYTLNKVKGETEIKENPKTGVFTYTLLILMLIGVSIYGYYALYKNSYFKKY